MDRSQDEDPAGSSAGSSPPSSSSNGDDPADSSQPPSPPKRTPTPSSIAKQSVPEVYPQVLALPIARRPLFPGFYKAVVVRNPAVVAAIKEMMKRGQPYLGAFLLKDENTDSDIITDINSVHPVGVFAQITSVFSANTGSGEDKEEGLTAVLYPHRRIKITDLIKTGEHLPLANVAPEDVQTVTPPETPPPSPSTDEVSQLPPGK
jgi:ATP-dependent Lon protease